MRLEALTGEYESLLYMERFVGEGTRTYSPFAMRTDVGLQYQPRLGVPAFELVTVRAPKDRIAIIAADPPASLHEYYVRPNDILFVIHPEVWSSPGIEHLDELHRWPRDEPIAVAPTATTRTVFAFERSANVPPHFVKLHLPRRISRFNRRLRRNNIVNSVAITRDVAHVNIEKFAYLADVLGLTLGESDDAWGFLVREAVQRPYQGRRILIPCFALYGGDLNRPDDPPLVVQLIERLGAEPESFVLDEIMLPLVECWIRIVREWGILLESHGQNTLLELDEDFHPRRIVHRDFDVWVDVDVRRRRGLEEPFAGGIGADTGRPVEQHYSVVYDRFICHEFFDYLLQALGRFYSIDLDAIRGSVIETFHRAFPDSDRFFPPQTMFYFSNEPQPSHEFTLVDMKRAPEWR